MALLIRGGLIVTGDAEDRRLPAGDLLIRDGRIVAIGPDLAREAAAPGAPVETIDARDKIVMPGLVNAHTHSNEGFEQGAYDNLPLELWLLESYPPWGMPALSERQHYLRTMITALQSIRSGVTTVQDDLLHASCTPEGLDGAARAYLDAGLRANITVTLWNRGMLDSLPFAREIIPAPLQAALLETPLPTAKDYVDLFHRHHRNWHGREGRIGVILGPCAPQRCSDDLLEECAALSASLDLPIHCHTLETRTQAVTAAVLYNRTMVEHLADLGLLTHRLTLNHAIWLTRRDIEMIGAAGASISHNPLSNMKLGSGICPVRALLEAGANIGLGTDGLTTSDTGDMVAALRAAALLHKLGTPDYRQWGTAEEAFRMATMGGARSCLMADEIGSLEPGKSADVILVDRKDWGFIPLNDPVRQFAFSVTSEAVTHNIVGGRVLMRDRRIEALDEAAIKAEVAEEAERFRRDDMPKMKAGAAPLRPHVAAIYCRAMATPLPDLDWALRPPPASFAAG